MIAGVPSAGGPSYPSLSERHHWSPRSLQLLYPIHVQSLRSQPKVPKHYFVSFYKILSPMSINVTTLNWLNISVNSGNNWNENAILTVLHNQLCWRLQQPKTKEFNFQLTSKIRFSEREFFCIIGSITIRGQFLLYLSDTGISGARSRSGSQISYLNSQSM